MGKRIIRKIPTQPGTLTDGQNIAKVSFDLTEWQDFIDQIPGFTSASGNIQFEKIGGASSFFRRKVLLRGGGIEVEIMLRSTDRFDTTGPITDIP
jgi:hypothetical protein